MFIISLVTLSDKLSGILRKQISEFFHLSSSINIEGYIFAPRLEEELLRQVIQLNY